MKLEKRFCWKVLSEDGLLKDHRPIGPYYSQTTFDEDFDTEQAAVGALIRWKKANEYGMENEMILITTYRQAWD